MSIEPGVRLGRYEIRSKIGEGGMGEVYRARDEKLSRDVAIKVLPESLASDKDRLLRFEKEAEATGYMSPEQVRGNNADHRSDIFSFGSIMVDWTAVLKK